jgi:hypothetical protein
MPIGEATPHERLITVWKNTVACVDRLFDKTSLENGDLDSCPRVFTFTELDITIRITISKRDS